MIRVILFFAVISLAACKTDNTTKSTPAKTTQKQEPTAANMSDKEREDIKKTLRELLNIEVNIQGAINLSDVVASRSKNAKTLALAKQIKNESENVLLSITDVMAQTKMQPPENLGRGLRDVAETFKSTSASEIDQLYQDWVAKFCLKIGNSMKSISKYGALETTDLAKVVEEFTSSLKTDK